jgi:Protein of unknown function (DUF1566)
MRPLGSRRRQGLGLLALVGSGAAGCGGGCSGREHVDPSRPAEAGVAAMGSSACHTGWPMPNAPSSGLPNLQSYDTSASGAVLDRVTGLLWQEAVDPNGYSWSGAAAYCDRLGLVGYHDWRLPSVVELVSIVDVGRADPAIDPVAFPATPSLPFWSSQTDVGNSGLGWYVYFKNGGAYGGNDVSDPQRVRCVRGPVVRKSGGPSCYVVASGVVSDTNTSLAWQQATEPGSYAWSDARSHCAGLRSNGGGWRLPSMNELMTLVDLTRVDPAIDPSAFPDMVSDFFWSSSPAAAPPGTAWGVSFSKGSAGASLVANAYRVRCVR